MASKSCKHLPFLGVRMQGVYCFQSLRMVKNLILLLIPYRSSFFSNNKQLFRKLN
jgi:hypothetical protein